MLRKLRSLSEKILGEEKTEEIIKNTTNEFLQEHNLEAEVEKLSEETKPKKKKSDK